ncbi:hypothetical protein FGSG_13537 [Fusarium graminearum PH-1]|uniref:Chromosome 4, complete genome n=1 Tax=Gibberella zeae (strain ATCC MYA-4620 / CBS 123657 / FGSC 9075 / NRRL 31084 / PH-1) TaxID=229533 RepID=I1S9K6_GIBZE|nr:hypothetical protein FGSG_13537 [Fusarium graminearum PH-1]ESU15791.1 hypothetical protein FGSG_13537 [Fusarium graminearum PH-1]CEF83815.1 unnamed protein product [Fusarium graminearum]|eukprot:XP_011328525.1 hypothetical protein FGSG_13537 [Fusarium graminearum PH-1]
MALPVSDGIFRYQPRKGCASPNQESCDTSSVYIMQLFRGTRHWNTRIRIHSPEGQAKKAAAMMSMLSDKQWHVQASGRNTCQQRMMIWDIKITMLKATTPPSKQPKCVTPIKKQRFQTLTVYAMW